MHWFRVVFLIKFLLVILVTRKCLSQDAGTEENELEPNKKCHREGYFGSTLDCSVFYRCVNDPVMNGTLDKFAFECPPGLIFDKNIQSCNREDDVDPKPPCFNNKTNSSSQPIHYPNNILITGSKYGLVYFKYNTTDAANYEEVESLEIQNVLIDPAILLGFLSLTTNLRRLILRDVQFTSDIEDRICLQHLEDFYFSHVNILKLPPIGQVHLQPNETTQIEDFRTYRAMFHSLVFFYKGNSWNWRIEDISRLRTNIDVSLHGTQLFQMNWMEGQVMSRLIFTNDIISNWNGPALEKLALRDCPLNIHVAPTSLKIIDFERVSFTNGTGSDVLRKNKGLNSIRLYFDETLQYPKVYLSDVPKRVEYLRIGHGNVVKSETNPFVPFPIGSFELHAEFLHLDTLLFYKCRIEEDIVRDFSAVFKAKKVGVVFSSHTQDQNYVLLRNMLRGNEKLEWIGMRDFRRLQNQENADVEEFLMGAGIQVNQTQFVIQKKGGVWVGRALTSGDEIL